MATDTKAGEETQEAKGGKRKLLIVVGLVVVLLAAGAFVGLKVFGGGGGEAEAPPESEPPVEGEVLEVATLTSTLAGDENLARVGLAIVTAEGASAETVTARFALLKDAAVSELARTKPATLRTAEGADRLRTRLTKRAHEIYPDGEVLRVLLTELVVQ